MMYNFSGADMKITAVFFFLLAAAALLCGQAAAAPSDVCTKNVSFAVAEGGQPVPAIPKFTAKFIDKKLPKEDYPGLCFSQIPTSAATNYVVVLSTSEAMFEGLTPTAHTYTSAPAPGSTTKTSSYGGTWSYNYAGVPPSKTTATLDLQRDDKPKALFAKAYNQQGRLVSSYSLAALPSKEKLLEYILAAIAGDKQLSLKQSSTATPLSVYYVNCDVDSPAVQLAAAGPPPLAGTLPEPSRKELPPPPMPLEIWSSPPGADISLDGMSIGKTPHSLVVPPGDHVITLRKQDYGTWERNVQVTPDKRKVVAYLEQKSLSLKFAPSTSPPEPSPKEAQVEGELSFWSTPTGADIFVDGGYVGQTPFSLTVAGGAHAVALRKKNFGTWQRKVVVNGKQSVGATLEAKSVGPPQ